MRAAGGVESSRAGGAVCVCSEQRGAASRGHVRKQGLELRQRGGKDCLQRRNQYGGRLQPRGRLPSAACGGDVPAGMSISEDYLLQLEREGFLKLCGNKKTAQRIQHMLKTGKPLRN